MSKFPDSKMHLLKPTTYFYQKAANCNKMPFVVLQDTCKEWNLFALRLEELLENQLGAYCLIISFIAVFAAFLVGFLIRRRDKTKEQKIDLAIRKFSLMSELLQRQREVHEQNIKLLQIYREQVNFTPSSDVITDLEQAIREVDIWKTSQELNIGDSSSTFAEFPLKRKRSSLIPRSNKAMEIRMSAIKRRPSTVSTNSFTFRGTSA